MIAGRGDEAFLAAGGPARHVPVLRDEVMAALAPREGGLYLDATFGVGGYSRALLALPGLRVLALDRDPIAIAGGAELVNEAQGRLCLVQEKFGRLELAARERGFSDFDGVVLDIGVSSMQIDDAGRGFSFRGEGPLDMRMDRAGTSAADLVNTAGETTLANIFYYFGEERASRRIAHAIVMDRAKAPFTSTAALASLIARVAPGRAGAVQPATRVFQALRIYVNGELDELEAALNAAFERLAPQGRLVVISFHSLEDRIVKQFMRRHASTDPVYAGLPFVPEHAKPKFKLVGKFVQADSEETARNPRARSARLRVAERLSEGLAA
jgi:16S rRNA (cytosine1402-N4)-methyltransferase